MKRLVVAAALVAGIAPATAADVGVSISIGEPGFYGRIDIGGFPQPRVVYRDPIVVERIPVGRPPIYLRVPPGHAKNWRKHCREYRACGERVYFVQDNWYSQEYAPRYQERHGNRHSDRGEGRGDDRREAREEHGRGHGKGPHGGDRGHGRDH